MFGILNLNKPVGCTSRDAVNRVQRLIRPVKVGHAGTLDPLAQGVLVLCLGPATRLIERVQQMPKHYRGTFRLGCHSPTDDTEGEVVPLSGATPPPRAAITAALGQFVGRIHQRPPAYSALKIGGQRAYHLARKGQAVTLPLRPVTIHALSINRFEYPELVLDIECGSGTYIRSLGRDLAKVVGTAAVMTGLTRTAIGPYAIDDATRSPAPNSCSAGHRTPVTPDCLGQYATSASDSHASDRCRAWSSDIGHPSEGRDGRRDTPGC